MSSDGDSGDVVRADTRATGVAVTPPCGALAPAGDVSRALAFVDSAFAARGATTRSATRCITGLAAPLFATTSGPVVDATECSERSNILDTDDPLPTRPGISATRLATIAGVREMVGDERVIRLPPADAAPPVVAAGDVFCPTTTPPDTAPATDADGAASTSAERSMRTSGRLS